MFGINHINGINGINGMEPHENNNNNNGKYILFNFFLAQFFPELKMILRKQ